MSISKTKTPLDRNEYLRCYLGEMISRSIFPPDSENRELDNRPEPLARIAQQHRLTHIVAVCEVKGERDLRRFSSDLPVARDEHRCSLASDRDPTIISMRENTHTDCLVVGSTGKRQRDKMLVPFYGNWTFPCRCRPRKDQKNQCDQCCKSHFLLPPCFNYITLQ